MAVSTTLLETMAPAKATANVEEIPPNKTNTVETTYDRPRHYLEDTLILTAVGLIIIINIVTFGIVIDLSVRNRVLMTHILPNKI
jgi:hypothetical protein